LDSRFLCGKLQCCHPTPSASDLRFAVWRVGVLDYDLIVLPLSGVPRVRNAMTLPSRVNGVVAVLLCIGLTIALLVRWNAASSRSVCADRP
jgi:hypothetical protein